MVAGRLLVGLLVLGQAACLIPQDDPILVPLPPTRNRPPRIQENSVTPPRSFPAPTLFTGDNCPEQVLFGVTLEDPDVDDVLTLRWFIDYDPNNNPVSFGTETRVSTTGAAVRGALEQTFSLRPGSPLAVPGIHLVEAVVADGQLIGREPQPLARDEQGNVTEVSYSDTFAWYISVEDQVCP